MRFDGVLHFRVARPAPIALCDRISHDRKLEVSKNDAVLLLKVPRKTRIFSLGHHALVHIAEHPHDGLTQPRTGSAIAANGPFWTDG